MLPREVITLQIAESKTVSELLSVLMTYSKMTTIDRENFWLYKQSVETKELIPL